MKTRHYLFAALAALLAIVFQSCSSDKAADASDILSTVPSDVSLVAVINAQSILEKTGCKVDDDKITPGQEINNAIAKITSQEEREIVSAICNGNSGINPTALVVFRDGYNTYLTGIASDPSKLKKLIEEKNGQSFKSSNGIDIASTTAIAGNRFWINLTKNYIDENDIRHYNTLSESQSFLSNPYSSQLSSITKDVEGWGNIMGLMNTRDSKFQERAMTQMVLQTLFEDPSSFTFSIMSEQGAITMEASIINSKGKTAKFLLPYDKVDISTVASIGGTADGVAAISIPGKMIEKLQKETNASAPSMAGIYLNQLGCIDGTTAFAISENDDVKGVITTNGKDTAALTSFLSSTSDLKFVMNGKLLEFSKGPVSGKCNVADLAKDFKGAMGGIVFGKISDKKFADVFDSASVMLMPEDGGMLIRFKGKSLNKKVNPIVSIINL